MKYRNLKIISSHLAFLVGITSVWFFGGFSYLNIFFEQDSEVLQTVTEVSIRPIKVISVEIDKPFIRPNLRFEDYPVSEIYKGNIAKPKNLEDFINKDFLQYASENYEVNFAGHYLLAVGSCGMWCSTVDIIDAKTGKVYGVDVSPEVCFPHLNNEFECNEEFTNVDYRIDSNLLILFGYKFTNDYESGAKGFHYYKFEKGKFIHLKSVLVKDQRSAMQIQLDGDDKGDK